MVWSVGGGWKLKFNVFIGVDNFDVNLIFMLKFVEVLLFGIFWMFLRDIGFL